MPIQVQYRLLIVRLGAMGDILHALPAVTALREAHPTWIIDWAIDPRWRFLLTSRAEEAGAAVDSDEHGEGKPLVDHLIFVPSKEWGKRPFASQTWAAIRALRLGLKGGAYDAVLDLQGSIRSAFVARMSGCARRIGEQHPRETPARWFYSERVDAVGQHVVEQDIELASAVAGDLLVASTAVLPVDSAAEIWCDEQEEIRRGEWTRKPIILIHPGAGWGAKRWPPERYAAVATEFAERGAIVLINAGPGEDSLAAAAAGGSGASILRTTLPQLIALTRRVTLVIGGDTGPVHLASALGKPVVGIYGPTDPKRNGPFAGPSRILRNPESRSDHTRREAPEAGLLTIAPESVIAAAVELMLATRQQQQAAQAARTATDRIAAEGKIWDAEPSVTGVNSVNFVIEDRSARKIEQA